MVVLISVSLYTCHNLLSDKNIYYIEKRSKSLKAGEPMPMATFCLKNILCDSDLGFGLASLSVQVIYLRTL